LRDVPQIILQAQLDTDCDQKDRHCRDTMVALHFPVRYRVISDIKRPKKNRYKAACTVEVMPS